MEYGFVDWAGGIAPVVKDDDGKIIHLAAGGADIPPEKIYQKVFGKDLSMATMQRIQDDWKKRDYDDAFKDGQIPSDGLPPWRHRA